MIERLAESAPIKVTREIRTARQCMFPIEGRGVLAYSDSRLGFLTIVSATQMPHIVQRGVAECLGLSDSSIRVISPDVGGGFGYKGLLCREEVTVAWLALHVATPVRWLEDARERLSANANTASTITAHRLRQSDGRFCADCVANVDAGASPSSDLVRARARRWLACCRDPTISSRTAAAPAVATNKC